MRLKKILYVVNVDWFFISHRLPIAIEAKKQNYDIYIATKITEYKKLLISHGFKVYDLKLERQSQNPISFLIYFFNLINIFKKVNPDIVHSITIKPIIFSGIASLAFKKIKFIYAVSGLGFVFSSKGLKSKIRRFIILLIYKLILGNKNFKIIFQNKSDMHIISRITNLTPENSIIIEGSGVNLDDFKPEDIENDKISFLFASRLLYSKGVKDFIDASKLVDGATFNIAGSFDLENKECVPKEKMKKWLFNSKINFLGEIKDMNKLINNHNIVVLPSFYGEGLPKILIEAAACGRAIITTDHPGCRDAIINDITGILIPPRDTKALAMAMQKLVNNPNLCKKMGLMGRKLAEKKYGIDKIIKQHMNIYK